MFLRHFLARRRYDPAVLAASVAAIGVLDNLAKALLVLFAFAGFYLVVGRHRSVRRTSWGFSAALFAYGVATLAMGFLRGEPFWGNRQSAYSLIFIGFAFLPFGLVLVRRPLDAAVSGARTGTLLVAILALGEYALTGDRVGLGANVALFAFVVVVLGLVARLDAERPWRFLPNSRLWLYLSFLPVLVSQTRAAWFVYALAICLDLARLAMGSRRLGSLPRGPVVAIAAAGLVGVSVLAAGIVPPAYERAREEFRTYSVEVAATTSTGIRLAMWQGAVAAIADHPLFGVGPSERMEAVAERMPASAEVIRSFTHLHNLVLDEALSHGIFGLGLLFAVFAAFLLRVARGTRDPAIRDSALLLVVLVFTFGSFHGVMLNETTLIATFAAMAVMLAEIDRRANRMPIAG